MALISNQPVFTDSRTRNKIDLHLRDINDEITENDIANVKTDVTANSEDDPDTQNEVNDILIRKRKEDKDDKTNDIDGNSSNSIETPWNVLG